MQNEAPMGPPDKTKTQHSVADANGRLQCGLAGDQAVDSGHTEQDLCAPSSMDEDAGQGDFQEDSSHEDRLQHLHGEEEEECDTDDGGPGEAGEDQDEEDCREEGNLLRGFLCVVWYGGICVTLVMGILIALPHIYLAAPSCPSTCQAVASKAATHEHCERACGELSTGVASLVEKTQAAVHYVITAILPLPSQPGTEQYWDVRLRRRCFYDDED